MTPWRRRLGDVGQLIEQAERNYFEPDLFRLNVNNAIQTARTVTFLIHKNKASIPDFEEWYRINVLDRLKGDRVMEWLKESRNHIEKEGDLDVYSECNLETIFSYTDPGPRISLKDMGQLFVGTKRLIRMIRKIFPTGVFRDSAIAIDRRWVATSLPEFELTDALHYGYSELARVVESLDKHVGEKDGSSPVLRKFGGGRSTRRAYLKTDDGRVYSLVNSASRPSPVGRDEVEERYDLKPFADAFESTADLNLAIERFADLASGLYTKDGYHITIGFLLDEKGDLISIMRPEFSDQVEKLIFWNELAHAAEIDREICGAIFISEIWLRKLDGFPQKRVSDLKITGEALQIVAVNRNACLLKTIPIVNDEAGSRLDIKAAELKSDTVPNFLVPLRKVWANR